MVARVNVKGTVSFDNFGASPTGYDALHQAIEAAASAFAADLVAVALADESLKAYFPHALHEDGDVTGPLEVEVAIPFGSEGDGDGDVRLRFDLADALELQIQDCAAGDSTDAQHLGEIAVCLRTLADVIDAAITAGQNAVRAAH